MNLEDLNKEYDKLQNKYGSKELNSIYNGGCKSNPDIMFVFMNPTGKNIASVKTWKGIRSPWLGTKNIWKLFHSVNLLSDNIYDKITSYKPKDWSEEFCIDVYNDVEKHKYFITNLGKCTQVDARPLTDDILSKYLKYLKEEIYIVNPKIIITLGNQVSSILLNKTISVSKCRKESFDLVVNNNTYKVYPVYYPVGNGIFNMDKAIEDINYIINNMK